jgi:LmbE family N-acetylglucosaminyl deacetylase
MASGDDVNALVVVAHPDDETIAVGGRLWTWPSASVVHLTYGAPNNPRFAREAGFVSPETYAEARARELNCALHVAGVSHDNRYQYDYLDQETCFHLVEITGHLVDLVERLKPGLIVTHAYEGGHPDHDSAAFAVRASCRLISQRMRNVPIIVEAPFYHHAQPGGLAVGEFLPQPDRLELELELSASERAAKQDMMACFESQRRVLTAFTTERDRFRLAPDYDFTQPPHEGPLNYEILGWELQGTTWRQQARGALETLGLVATARSGSGFARNHSDCASLRSHLIPQRRS